MSERRKLALNELGKAQLYQRLMAMEFSLLTAYFVLFLTSESILLALAFFLTERKETVPQVIIAMAAITIIGIFIGGLFLIYLNFKASEIDRWKNKILELTQGTDMEDDFKPWRRGWWLWGYHGVGGRTALFWVVPLSVFLIVAWGLIWYYMTF